MKTAAALGPGLVESLLDRSDSLAAGLAFWDLRCLDWIFEGNVSLQIFCLDVWT